MQYQFIIVPIINDQINLNKNPEYNQFKKWYKIKFPETQFITNINQNVKSKIMV